MQKELVMQALPTEFCHASTVLKLASGEILCAWFGGTHEGKADVAIYMSRRNLQGEWSEPLILGNGAEANWNPVLLAVGEKILLFYKEGQEIASWRTYLRESLDEGQTWGVARELVVGDTSGGRGPVRNKPILLADGSVLAGASTELGLWQAYADVSVDAGATWQRSEPIAIAGLAYQKGERTTEDSKIAVSEQSFYGRGVIQPSLWQSSAKNVHMLLRSSEGYIYRSDSADGGRTWCGAYQTELVNNNSGLDLVKLADGTLFLVCNPVAANWGQRSPLSLFKSCDNGVNWEKLLDLETEPAEFSYPAIITDEKNLYITYTYKRENIALVTVAVSEL